MARALKTLLCLLLVVALLVGCTPTSPAGSEEPKELTLEERLAEYAKLGTSPDDNYRTWYEIFVYSYCDSNGDGIGDLQGVISKLDELTALGVTGIWLMPIHPSTSYHKYNVNDYYAIDPAYGTMADFDQLIAECDKRGIKVILDLVVNHSGDQNPWFTEAVEYLQSLGLGEFGYEDECKYFGYYNFVESSTNPGKGFAKIPGTFYHYECQFSGDMPDLNWECAAMREDVKNVMQFWLDKGAAGFRVDAAKEFYTGNISKNVEVMSWLQETATSIKPDAYLVAEVWEPGYKIIESYYESNFTSIFNYPFGNYDGKLIQVVNGRGNPAMVSTWATAQQTASGAYAGASENYIDAPFISNHDVGRIYGFVSGDVMRMKMAAAMSLFMSGSVFVYYGDEIGMPGSGNDPSKRAPMVWSAEGAEGTTTLPPGCTLPDVGYPLGGLEEQKADESSLYNYYREAIAIRNAIPTIARGVPTAEAGLNKGCVSASRRTWGEEECIILMNIDDEATVADLSGYTDWEVKVTLSADGQPIEMDGTNLNMAAYGVAILVPTK